MGGRAVPTLRSPYSLFPTHYPPYFHILAHSLAISCTFLHLRKSQLFSFHGIAHSSTKNRGWGTPAASTLTPARITESDAQIAGSQPPVTSHSALYPAISRFCANGHSSSIHCPSQWNPVRSAIPGISSAAYLCELSVQMVSSSLSMIRRPVAGIFTACRQVERKC